LNGRIGAGGRGRGREGTEEVALEDVEDLLLAHRANRVHDWAVVLYKKRTNSMAVIYMCTPLRGGKKGY
jgi:hypothetical protein